MIFASAKHYRSAPLSIMQGTLTKRREILRRGSTQVRGTAVYGARSVGDAIAGMDARSYNLLYVLDDDMRLLGTVGEGELMDYALCRGSGAKLADITKAPGRLTHPRDDDIIPVTCVRMRKNRYGQLRRKM